MVHQVHQVHVFSYTAKLTIFYTIIRLSHCFALLGKMMDIGDQGDRIERITNISEVKLC